MGTVASGFILETISNGMRESGQLHNSANVDNFAAASPLISRAYPMFFTVCACFAAAPVALLAYLSARPFKSKQE